MSDTEMITGIKVPIALTYTFTAGRTGAKFLRHLKSGRIVGQRCPSCSNVYVPPHGCCARCGVMTEEEVEVSGRGTIRYFTIVHIPIPGSPVTPPFVVAQILLDGADIPTMHLIGEVPIEEVRLGMRVEPVWREREEWDYSFENITYFRPTGEPDVDIAQV
jgi:uncharacterized OB-fold protein